MKQFFFLLIGLFVTSCETLAPQTDMVPSPPKLEKISFADLPDWTKDNAGEALTAFSKSCARIEKTASEKAFPLGGTYALWQAACRARPSVSDSRTAQIYFETQFTPYAVTFGGKADGLFTGYYEPSLKGSLVKTDTYQTPLRARPEDLVMVNLGEFRPELKGQRIAGRVNNGYLKPYEDRAKIEQGALPDPVDKPLVWVDSAVDAFFLQVQGSGVVTLPDNTTLRVGYDGQNGHPYTAIGKELIARGALTKDNVSMQSIRAWMAEHPDEAIDVMRTNKSYVFFKKLDTDGPVGAEGIVLTPERSLAVDNNFWPYGIPIYLSAENPEGGQAMNRLMVAQDTGGAIKGAVRGDFFWGYGERAAENAGKMKSVGKMWILLPKDSIPTL